MAGLFPLGLEPLQRDGPIEPTPLLQCQSIVLRGCLRAFTGAVPLMQAFRLTARQPHDPGMVPEVVQDRAAHMGSGKAGKRFVVAGPVALRCVDQAQQANLQQIILRFGTAARVVPGQGPDQGQMGHETLIGLSRTPQASPGGLS